MKYSRKYIVTPDADMMAPKWLSVRINYDTVSYVYRIVDGAARLKGVRVGHEFANIRDTIRFDGKWLSVERR